MTASSAPSPWRSAGPPSSASCAASGARGAASSSAYDHVVPRAQGGRTTWENIVIACVPCNQKKGGRTPAQAGLKPLSTPEKPRKLPGSVQLTFAYEKGMPLS